MLHREMLLATLAKTMNEIKQATQSPNRRPFLPRRWVLVLILPALVAVALGVWRNWVSQQVEPLLCPDTRIPVAHPPVEPTRPDLFGEPRPDE